MTTITRFAPSPTGFLHIGSLRTVLYNYLYAKKNNGKFILRVEDTDKSRQVEGSIENMLKVLASVGLIPDEGPNNPGDKGPYYQSERLEIYTKYIKELIEKNKAYYCFCSEERLTKLREEQANLGLPTKYDSACRYLSEEEIKKALSENSAYTVRLKVPKNRKVVFYDTIKGKVEVDSKDIGEQVLLKSDGFPTYHLANVVDDHLMGITDVIRGDEWTPSTPKHVLLYEAFDWEQPTFSHIPLLLGNDKKKLSKRSGDVSVEKYLEKGYLTQGLINYISLLGWNPKTIEEFFSMEELINKFELKNVHKSGAVFDIERLDFFNSHYLKNIELKELYNKFTTYLERYDKDFLETISKHEKEYNLKILNELKTRIKKFSDYKELTTFFYNDTKKVNPEMILNEKMKINDIETIKKALKISIRILKERKNINFNNIEEIKELFIPEIKNNDMKNGQVLWPTRVSLSGEQFSPGALELIFILGVEKSIERLEKVLKEI